MVGVSDLCDVFRSQFTVCLIHHAPEFPGIDEQHFAPPVPQLATAAITGEKPEACWNLGRVEELTGQGDHTVDQFGFDKLATYLALPRLVR